MMRSVRFRTLGEGFMIMPCPFCGGEAEYDHAAQWDDGHVLACGYCGCELSAESKEDVIKAWNTRQKDVLIRYAEWITDTVVTDPSKLDVGCEQSVDLFLSEGL